MLYVFAFASLLAHLVNVLAAVNGPVINQNFPDPSILIVGGTTYVEFLVILHVARWSNLAERYAFSTNSGSKNIPVATSSDGGATWTVTGSDALPNVGSWASTGSTWAPDVINRGDGTFVLCM